MNRSKNYIKIYKNKANVTHGNCDFAYSTTSEPWDYIIGCGSLPKYAKYAYICVDVHKYVATCFPRGQVDITHPRTALII